MSQLDDINEQQWHARIARKRLDLSTSVEETLAENSFQEDEWSDELDGVGEINSSKHESQFDIQTGIGSQKNLALVPPRLSLQSRSLPVVHADTESSSHLAVRITRSELKLAGRSTKVRLKAIPRTEELQKAVGTEHLRATNPEQEYKEPLCLSSQTLPVVPGDSRAAEHVQAQRNGYPMPSGSATFKRGQGEIAVENIHVTPSSVITAMLTSDPGPVVVQYISLHPGVGFTVHLSAPAEKETSFNYIIFSEEPC
jgi:hypothetical protein